MKKNVKPLHKNQLICRIITIHQGEPLTAVKYRNPRNYFVKNLLMKKLNE